MPLTTIAYFWHFQCPECGMGHEETGRLAEAHEIFCELCLNEDGVHVRLRRWQADHDDNDADTAIAAGVCPRNEAPRAA